MKAVIYHNPRCSTSRKALEMIREAGLEPEVVEYLQAPPSRDELASLIAGAGLSVRDAIRTKESAYEALGLADPALDDASLLDAMLREPILIQRPFVRTGIGTRLARPVEIVREILPPPRKDTPAHTSTPDAS